MALVPKAPATVATVTLVSAQVERVLSTPALRTVHNDGDGVQPVPGAAPLTTTARRSAA